MRWLGLDVGDRRIGVAVGDPTGLLATPHGVVEVQGRAKDAARVVELAAEVGAEGFVVGLPLKMDGNAGDQAEKVRRFVKELRRHTGLPIEYVDERLTSVAASRSIQEAGGRASRQRGTVDAVAAALILQTHLDRLRLAAERGDGAGSEREA